MANQPLSKLDPNGQASILSYNVPEPVSYSLSNLMELDFLSANEKVEDYFKSEYINSKVQTASMKRFSLPVNPTLGNNELAGFVGGNIDFMPEFYNRVIYPNDISSDRLERLLASGYLKEQRFKNLFGNEETRYIPNVPSAKKLRPRILLREFYKLSSYLGNYGAGRTIKTFSLLPGEKTKISVSTYKRTAESRKDSSSILDSFESSNATEFEKSVTSERSHKENESSNFGYHVEAEVSGSCGFVSGKVSGGVRGESNSAREEFVKNTRNATSKNVSKASSKRDISVNTSSEFSQEEREEMQVVREIENINVSRTLNFTFRQMNQEFITLFYMVDLRIAFFNGEVQKEYSLTEIDQLLDEVVLPNKKAIVKQIVLNQITQIKDHLDNQANGIDSAGAQKPFIQQKFYKDTNGNDVAPGYYSFAKDVISQYQDAAGNSFSVPGIIMSVDKYVLRTDGVIVDAILGQGDGLDTYSHGLQDEEVRSKKIANDLREKEVERNKLANEIIESGDKKKAEAYSLVFPCCPDNLCCCNKCITSITPKIEKDAK